MEPPFKSNFRRARETDLPAIVAIYNATIPGRMVTAHTEPVSVASRVEWFHEHDRENCPLWVLTENGAVIAWMSLGDFHPRPAYHPTAEISVYVHEEHRRRGLARWLVRAAIAAAPGCRRSAIVGLIWGHNLPSLQLFAGEGFARWGFLPRVANLDDTFRDLVIVGRHLD